MIYLLMLLLMVSAISAIWAKAEYEAIAQPTKDEREFLGTIKVFLGFVLVIFVLWAMVVLTKAAIDVSIDPGFSQW